MKAKKWIAVVLSVAVALNGIPITDITVVQAEEVVNRLNNKDEKMEQNVEHSRLQYMSEEGAWTYIKEDVYYGQLSKLRFSVTADSLQSDKTVVTITGENGVSENYMIGTDSKLTYTTLDNKTEYVLALDLFDEKWRNVTDYQVDVRTTKKIGTETNENDMKETSEEQCFSLGNFHFVNQRIEMKVTCAQDGVWSDEEESISLQLVNKINGVNVDFYVKKPGEENYEKISTDLLSKVNDTTYTYAVSENGKGDWYFAAAYNLENVSKPEYSKEQKITIMQDKIVPIIRVKQNGEGWTNKDVVFELSNEADNISDVTYYVKKNYEEWLPLEEKSYTISEEQNNTQYQFKAVSELGENSNIYQKASVKTWISDTFTVSVDKTAPAEPQINIVRAEGDTGTDYWYGKTPSVSFTYIQDQGSTVALYYRLSTSGVEEYEKYTDGQILKVPTDGKYILEYYTEDEAGNRSETFYQKLYVDTNKPKIMDISFFNEDGTALQLYDILVYPFISKKKVVVSISATDSLSGVDKIIYASSDGKQITAKSVNGSDVKFTISPTFKGKLKVYCVDKLGNRSDTKVSEGLISEAKKPAIKLFFDKDITKWQNSSIKCNVSVLDSDAGIRKIECEYNGFCY